MRYGIVWESESRANARRVDAAFAALALAVVVAVLGCSETRNLGSTVPHGALPVDDRNPILLTNDGASDNWQGEYAILLANGGGPKLAGIVVSTSSPWPNLDTNMTGWRAMVAAARTSGLRDIPDPIASTGPPLTMPASGRMEDTTPNRSEGAHLIIDTSTALSLPYRPLVVVTGGRLTDVADAYLMDPTVAARVVVVSSLGSTTAMGAAMGPPNGEMDPLADAIVTAHFRFVQVSAFYDQTADASPSLLADRPANAFGDWIAAKQPSIWNLAQAADQVGVVAVGIPDFVTMIENVSVAGPISAGASAGPDLVSNRDGSLLVVTQSAGMAATDRFWQLLRDPTIFQP